MIKRRDLILGGLGLGALGAAEAMRPRSKMTLLPKGATVDATIPAAFGPWQSHVSDLVSPEQAGRLAQTLYSEIVARVYLNDGTGAAVMLLAAYGDTQSDLLQLHRPESCYPAVGFTLQMTAPADLPLPGGANLPIKRVVATLEDRRENIVYWTRVGEALPRTGSEQRDARLKNAMGGYVADGILVRCSAIGDSDTSFKLLDAFVPTLLQATPKTQRQALVGNTISRRIA